MSNIITPKFLVRTEEGDKYYDNFREVHCNGFRYFITFVYLDGQGWGIIKNTNGKEIIPCQYESINDYECNFTSAYNNKLNRTDVIDKYGNIIIKFSGSYRVKIFNSCIILGSQINPSCKIFNMKGEELLQTSDFDYTVKTMQKFFSLCPRIAKCDVSDDGNLVLVIPSDFFRFY